MCEPASFIVTKAYVFWSKTSFSHENIITENNLEILDADAENIGLVRVEITPPNRDFSKPSRLWIYKVDQDLLPSWYDAADAEKRARKELAKWRKWHFATQTAGYRSTQTAGYRSTQTAGDDSTQTAGYRSTQTAGDGSTQKAGDQTVQIIRFWKVGQMQVKVRTITKVEANRWYVFEDGDWRLCTDAEAARAGEECG